MIQSVPLPPDSSALPESIRLLQLVWRLNVALQRTSLDMEQRLGVTGTQRFLLRYVGLVPGATRDALANVLSEDASVLQADLDRLVAGNLLVSQPGSAGYYLTSDGVSVNAAMTGTVEEAISKACDEATTYERWSFRQMIERVVSHLAPRQT